MERHGFIGTENGKKTPLIPYITRQEADSLRDIEREAGDAFCEQCLERAVDICRRNRVTYPPHITVAPDFLHTKAIGYLPMAYVYEAAARGLLEIKPEQSYPIMYCVVR